MRLPLRLLRMQPQIRRNIRQRRIMTLTLSLSMILTMRMIITARNHTRQPAHLRHLIRRLRRQLRMRIRGGGIEIQSRGG
ncbi:hypothetical protein BJX70DRAFT_379895 [Aspergillus crustosus]